MARYSGHERRRARFYLRIFIRDSLRGRPAGAQPTAQRLQLIRSGYYWPDFAGWGLIARAINPSPPTSEAYEAEIDGSLVDLQCLLAELVDSTGDAVSV